MSEHPDHEAGWMVTQGDPYNGFLFFGPFETESQAVGWGRSMAQASKAFGGTGWWVVPVVDPVAALKQAPNFDANIDFDDDDEEDDGEADFPVMGNC